MPPSLSCPAYTSFGHLMRTSMLLLLLLLSRPAACRVPFEGLGGSVQGQDAP